MRLEEISPKSRLRGIDPIGPVDVVGVMMHGKDALEITYKRSDGTLDQVIAYRADEAKLKLHQEAGRPFDADARDFRLAA